MCRMSFTEDTKKYNRLKKITLLVPVLIKINSVSANFYNTRPSLISNNEIYRHWLYAEDSSMTYVIYIHQILSFGRVPL